jgi:hypothetical protein
MIMSAAVLSAAFGSVTSSRPPSVVIRRRPERDRGLIANIVEYDLSALPAVENDPGRRNQKVADPSFRWTRESDERRDGENGGRDGPRQESHTGDPHFAPCWSDRLLIDPEWLIFGQP